MFFKAQREVALHTPCGYGVTISGNVVAKNSINALRNWRLRGAMVTVVVLWCINAKSPTIPIGIVGLAVCQ